jgi:hypothetical protein
VTVAEFRTGYMDKALTEQGLRGIIEDAQADLAGVDFDTLVGTGFSGGVVIPALALAMGKNFLLIRKENDDSHHGPGLSIGNLGARWIFVDDFVSLGRTKERVFKKVVSGAHWRDHDTEYVGDYLYANAKRWVPFAEQDEDDRSFVSVDSVMEELGLTPSAEVEEDETPEVVEEAKVVKIDTTFEDLGYTYRAAAA